MLACAQNVLEGEGEINRDRCLGDLMHVGA